MLHTIQKLIGKSKSFVIRKPHGYIINFIYQNQGFLPYKQLLIVAHKSIALRMIYNLRQSRAPFLDCCHA